MHRALYIEDILHCIFENLQTEELICIRHVCTWWNQICREHIWKNVKIDTNVPFDIMTKGPEALERTSVLRLLRATHSDPDIGSMIHHLELCLDNHKNPKYETGAWKNQYILLPTIQTATRVIKSLKCLQQVTLQLSLDLEALENTYQEVFETFNDLTIVIQSKNVSVNYILTDRANLPLHLNMLVWHDCGNNRDKFPIYNHRKLLLHPTQFNTRTLNMSGSFTDEYEKVAPEHLEMLLQGCDKLEEVILRRMPITERSLDLLVEHKNLKKIIFHNCDLDFEYCKLYILLGLKDLVELDLIGTKESVRFEGADRCILPDNFSRKLEILKIKPSVPLLYRLSRSMSIGNVASGFRKLRILDLEPHTPTPAFDNSILALLRACYTTIQELHLTLFNVMTISSTTFPQLQVLVISAPLLNHIEVITDLCKSSPKLKGGLDFTIKSTNGWENAEWSTLFDKINHLNEETRGGNIGMRYGPRDKKQLKCCLNAKLVRRALCKE